MCLGNFAIGKQILASNTTNGNQSKLHRKDEFLLHRSRKVNSLLEGVVPDVEEGSVLRVGGIHERRAVHLELGDGRARRELTNPVELGRVGHDVDVWNPAVSLPQDPHKQLAVRCLRQAQLQRPELNECIFVSVSMVCVSICVGPSRVSKTGALRNKHFQLSLHKLESAPASHTCCWTPLPQ